MSVAAGGFHLSVNFPLHRRSVRGLPEVARVRRCIIKENCSDEITLRRSKNVSKIDWNFLLSLLNSIDVASSTRERTNRRQTVLDPTSKRAHISTTYRCNRGRRAEETRLRSRKKHEIAINKSLCRANRGWLTSSVARVRGKTTQRFA